MELWVRSQDKEYFKQVGCVSYTRIISYVEFGDDEEKVGQIIHKRGHGIQCDGICLAEYPTKDRCLEIIDEIQKLLCQTLIVVRNLEVPEDISEYLKPKKCIVYQAQNKTPSIEYHEQSVVVYEMPKE